MNRVTRLLMCCIVVSIVVATCAGAATYRVRALQLLGTAGEPMGPSWANAISDSGRLAGTAYDSGTSHAVVTNEQGDLELLDEGFALGINSHGQAVGYATRAATWDSAGGLTALPLPTNSTFSVARAVNDSGRVVGEAWVGTSQVRNHVMVWDRGAAPIDLGEGCGNGVNAAGWVAGSTRDAGGNRRAYLWTPGGGMAQLLGGTSSEGNGLNALGQVAGIVSDATGTWACVWDANGNLRVLSTLSGSLGSAAYGINDRGAVVGTCETALGTYAVVWQPDGTVIRLGALPGQVGSVAYAINNTGSVAGCSLDSAGSPQAVVWDLIVPEPASILALLAGLIGIVPRLRRRY